MKFVHAADLHLDSPMRGLRDREGAPLDVLLQATRRATTRLIDLCIQEEADLLVLAGDVFDGEWQGVEVARFLSDAFDRLGASGAQVVWLRGNHDARTRQQRDFTWPDHVHELSFEAPQSIAFDDLGVVCHGQGFRQPAETRDLAAAYPPAVPGRFNLGVLHTALAGSEGHAPYAPTTREILTGAGYDYWALGHVHERAVISDDPWIIYPGNLQGRHARETGAKGAYVVEVTDGRVSGSPRFVPLDVVRWEHLRLCPEPRSEGTDASSRLMEVARPAIAAAWHATVADDPDRRLVVRITLEGSDVDLAAYESEPDRFHAELLSACEREGAIWLEALRCNVIGQDEDSLAIPAFVHDALREHLNEEAHREELWQRAVGTFKQSFHSALPEEWVPLLNPRAEARIDGSLVGVPSRDELLDAALRLLTAYEDGEAEA